MAYKQHAHEKATRGMGRGKCKPPRLGRAKSGTTMRSAQGVYLICADVNSAVSFVEFIHDRVTTILQTSVGMWAPQIYVSPIQGARNHIAITGSTTRVFRPDAQAQTPGKAKHFFPGFTIRFRTDHNFVNAAGVSETLTNGDYQWQFYWHDGQGRLTIDLTSQQILPTTPFQSS
jgi:hypothetical protein